MSEHDDPEELGNSIAKSQSTFDAVKHFYQNQEEKKRMKYIQNLAEATASAATAPVSDGDQNR